MRKGAKKPFACYTYEEQHWKKNTLLLGIDEAGRGALCGPLVVSGALLPPHTTVDFLYDSKKMSEKQRLQAYKWIMQHCISYTRVVHPRLIEKYNIYQITKQAMLSIAYECYAHHTMPTVLTDAMPFPSNTPWKTYDFIKGESKSASIAAASIIAKVTRDRILHRISKSFPLYQIEKHKGYATSLHRATIQAHQATVLHRTTFIQKIKKSNEKKYQQQLFC